MRVAESKTVTKSEAGTSAKRGVKNPSLYQINTRTLLTDLARQVKTQSNVRRYIRQIPRPIGGKGFRLDMVSRNVADRQRGSQSVARAARVAARISGSLTGFAGTRHHRIAFCDYCIRSELGVRGQCGVGASPPETAESRAEAAAGFRAESHGVGSSMGSGAS